MARLTVEGQVNGLALADVKTKFQTKIIEQYYPKQDLPGITFLDVELSKMQLEAMIKYLDVTYGIRVYYDLRQGQEV